MSLLIKIVCALVVLSVISNEVSANPQFTDIIKETIEEVRERVKASGSCAKEAGCHNGYCWTYCGLSLSTGDWCYTTKSYSYSRDYVTCTHDSQCDPCWKCGGLCALF